MAANDQVVAKRAANRSALSWPRLRRLMPGIQTIIRQGGLVAALALLVVVFTALHPGFLSSDNSLNILTGASVIAILAIGQTFVIITGGIDLSVGSILALSAMIGALLMNAGVAVPLAILIALLAGGGAGLINGVLVVTTGVTPFIVTLGTMSIFNGLALVINTGRPVYELPDSFVAGALTANFAGVPAPVWVMVAATIFFGAVLRRTVLGEYALAIGGNEEASRLAGIAVNRWKLTIYVLSGMLAATGGVLLAARLGTADPTAGSDLLLVCIAASVMGGASLFGGEGSIVGAMVGAILITTLQTGLTILGVATFYQLIAVGSVIIVAVAADQLARRRGGAFRGRG
jgi:ribose/xylose/arabinose/galactoside ABC-type transport system permease subunit